MSALADKTLLTPEQYLAIERRAATKSEYDRGAMVAMAGASREHCLIAGNLATELNIQLRERPCETFQSDMRVRTSTLGLYTYPDVVVVCGEASYLDDEVDTLLNPTVIVEVLSPSTESNDRGWKFEQYRQSNSLKEYVLIAQDRVAVDLFRRAGDVWTFISVNQLSDVLELTSIGVAVPLGDIYRRVEFPKDGPARPRLALDLPRP